MTYKVTVNNYQLGAQVRTTPTHKIISKERTDSRHTVIIYADINDRERQFIERVLSKKLTLVEQ